jgi:hAT family C-terminal dimerisation region
MFWESQMSFQVLFKEKIKTTNVMALVKVTKVQLQTMREDRWESLLSAVSLFCNNHGINIPNMEDKFIYFRSRCKAQQITNLHRYQVKIFYTVIDMQLQELNDQFDDVSSELLLCVACLNPRDLFNTFDKKMLLKLASFYPSEFFNVNPIALGYQLETYILDVRSDKRFLDLKDLNNLSKKLVETQKSIIYPNVYMLLKLALLLPMTTTTVERAFSAMKYIQTKLRNKMCDGWMNDCLITYIEKDVFNEIFNEPIMQHYQRMRTRKEELLTLDKM